MKKRIKQQKKPNQKYNRQKIHKTKIENKKYKEIPIKEEPIINNKIEIIETTIDEDIVNESIPNKSTKNDISKKLTITILALIVLLIASITIIPTITFKEDEIDLRYNKEFIDKDYKAKSLFKDYTKKVKVKNNINNKKIGEYEAVYNLKFGFLNIRKTKIINIIDDVKPNISLKGDNPTIVCPGKEYKEPGFEALDEYDGDLTKKVKVSTTKHKATYTVQDKSENIKKTIRKIIYEDKEKPKIELKGNSSITLYIGSQYIEPGYKATDNCDGDLTNKVKITGSVDANKAGKYTIKYKIADENNNETTAIREVTVKNWSVIRPSSGGSGRGIVYLTFDDGPNEGTTNKILDILKEEGVQATFFVTCNGPDYLIKRMHNEGHTVALHTATHNYNYVYSSINNYFEDLNRVGNRVKNLTGIDSKIIRFPGGSSNTISKKISPGIMTTLTSEVKKRGYKYYDWNVDSNDAAGANTNSVYLNVINNISLDRENVVLMHDIKTTTRDALRNIIRYGKNNGFTFKRITTETVMVTHGVNN